MESSGCYTYCLNKSSLSIRVTEPLGGGPRGLLRGVPSKHLKQHCTKTNVEADCIITHGKRLIPAGIKSYAKIESRDVRTLKKIIELLPAAEYGIIFSLDPHAGFIEKNIINIPIWTL